MKFTILIKFFVVIFVQNLSNFINIYF